MITQLGHACYRTPDLDRIIDFYCGKLGFAQAFEFKKDDGSRFGIYLKIGGRTFLEFFEADVDGVKERQSFQHICLEVDDLEATITALRERGVEITDSKLGMDHSYQAWITDPDGNRIELHQYTPESWQGPHL